MPGTNRKRYGRVERAQDRGNQVLRMHMLDGMTFRQIGAAMGIHYTRAHQLYLGALQRAQRNHDAEAHVSMQRTLGLLQVAISEAYEVVTRTCPKCHGHGTRNGTVCVRCDGTGLWYPVEERRRWLDRLVKATTERSRLLGEADPAVRDDDGNLLGVREIVARMDPDDITRYARTYLQGREDERRLGAEGLTAAVTNDEGEAG